MTMFGLTLWEPWCSAMAVGAKAIETRSWAPPRHVIKREGMTTYPIAIHASKKWTAELLHRWVSKPFDAILDQPRALRPGGRNWRPPTLGKVVAAGWITEAYRVRAKEGRTRIDRIAGPEFLLTYLDGIGDDAADLELSLGDYSDRRFAWITDLMPLEHPIAMKGAQGLYELDQSIERQIRDQVALNDGS